MKNKKPTKGRKPIELTVSGNELTKLGRKHPVEVVVAPDGQSLTRNGKLYVLTPRGFTRTAGASAGKFFFTADDLRTALPARTAKRRIAREAQKPMFIIGSNVRFHNKRPLSPEAQAAVDRVRKIAAEREAAKAAIDDAVVKIEAATARYGSGEFGGGQYGVFSDFIEPSKPPFAQRLRTFLLTPRYSMAAVVFGSFVAALIASVLRSAGVL